MTLGLALLLTVPGVNPLQPVRPIRCVDAYFAREDDDIGDIAVMLSDQPGERSTASRVRGLRRERAREKCAETVRENERNVRGNESNESETARGM